MEITELAILDPQPQKPSLQTKLDNYGVNAESACARAMAEAEEALRELSGRTVHLPIEPERPSVANEKAGEQSLISSGVPRGAPSPVDRLRLDPDLDFVFHNDGLIELTEPGFRRMLQAHSAGLDVVIRIDGRDVFRFLAPQVHAPRATARRRATEGPLNGADISQAQALRSQQLTELLRAEKSVEVALDMVNKERERHEIECLLPWHAAGSLSRRDAERVEQALADDRELAQRYELVLEELAATIHLNETLGGPSECALGKLFTALDAEEARLPRPRHRRFSETSAMEITSR